MRSMAPRRHRPAGAHRLHHIRIEFEDQLRLSFWISWPLSVLVTCRARRLRRDLRLRGLLRAVGHVADVGRGVRRQPPACDHPGPAAPRPVGAEHDPGIGFSGGAAELVELLSASSRSRSG